MQSIWHASFAGLYNFTVAGASGGAGYLNATNTLGVGGRGAVISGTAALLKGQQLSIVVGQTGDSSLPSTPKLQTGGGGGGLSSCCSRTTPRCLWPRRGRCGEIMLMILRAVRAL